MHRINHPYAHSGNANMSQIHLLKQKENQNIFFFFVHPVFQFPANRWQFRLGKQHERAVKIQRKTFSLNSPPSESFEMDF